MNSFQNHINAVAKIKNLPVNISTDGMTTFMLIAQLQLALRHPGNKGGYADSVRELAINLQNQLISRLPELKPILDQGWHPEFDLSINQRIVNVHNVYTLYSDAEENGNKFMSVSSRPQDWGDPRWNYHFVKFETKLDNTIYINNAHLWTTEKFDLQELMANFGQAIALVMVPGRPPEICDRSYLQEDDFWCEEWGELPPYFEFQEDDFWCDNSRDFL